MEYVSVRDRIAQFEALAVQNAPPGQAPVPPMHAEGNGFAAAHLPAPAPDGGLLDAVPPPEHAMVSAARGGTAFLGDDAGAALTAGLDGLDAAPDASLDALEALVQVANTAYGQIDYGTLDEDQQQALAAWRDGLREQLYAQRDAHFAEDGGLQDRYGAAAQFAAQRPDEAVPASLTAFQERRGPMVFDHNWENDCGRFASRLYNDQRAALLGPHAAAAQDTGQVDDEALEAAKDAPGVGALRRLGLTYPDVEDAQYNHHYKTVLAQDDDQACTLEAHSGKPFLLAPELHIYGSEDALRETAQGAAVTERSATGELGELDDLTPELRAAGLAGLSNPVNDAPAPQAAPAEEPAWLRDLRTAVGWLTDVPEGREEDLVQALVEARGGDEDFQELPVLEAWGGEEWVFSEERFAAWQAGT